MLECIYGDAETVERLQSAQELTTVRYEAPTGHLEKRHISGPDVDKANIFQIDLAALQYVQAPIVKPVHDVHRPNNSWHEENDMTRQMGWGPVPYDGLMRQLATTFQEYPSQEEQEKRASLAS